MEAAGPRAGAVAGEAAAGAGAGQGSMPAHEAGNKPAGSRKHRDRGGGAKDDEAKLQANVKSQVASYDAGRTKTLAAIEFGTMSGADMARASTIQITSRELYKNPTRSPAPFGCLDPRLGVSAQKEGMCPTCGCKMQDCAGHFGYIKLELPVFHIGFLKAVIEILQNICKSCSRVLLPEAERTDFLRMMTSPSADTLRKMRIRKRITEMCKKILICPWCSAHNGQVKKVPGAQGFKLLHDRYKRVKDPEVKAALEAFQEGFEVVREDPEIATYLSRAREDLHPIRARELLAAIPAADLPLLWADAERGRPEDLILTHLPVPPVAIRPSVLLEAGGGSNEDDLTIKLQEIVSMNSSVRLALAKGTPFRMLMENWDFLQVQVAAYINGDLPGLPLAVKAKRPIRGLCQRLKGKQGRFRGNLSGKRVDFSGRTVISPDPNLPLFCVGVPTEVAKDLTYPEKVTALNIERLRKLVATGSEVYPGANYVRGLGAGNLLTKNLKYADLAQTAHYLKIGDTVERHLQNGDVVLFNRQPSLHKMSIMCHRAVVMPGRTFRFNECCCAPYNADFDGDEMNLHVPQTEEARAEAALLMDVRENLITPRSGEPLIAATQDFLTSAYLLTRRDQLMTRDDFCQAVATLSDASERVVMPQPAVLKPIPLWTGKQVISMLLRPTPETDLTVSFEMRARNYMGEGAGKALGLSPAAAAVVGSVMCPEDGCVVFRDGALMCGRLEKSVIGGGSKKGLVFVLIRDNHPSIAARSLLRLTKVCTRWLTNEGFSIGIEDVAPSLTVSARKEHLISAGYAAANQRIAEYKAGRLDLLPGCNEEQSLESVLNGILSRLRDSVGQMCMEELPRTNSAAIMATCGSKGSTLNICQMVACVGQQSVGGSRIQEGFVDRTLPAFTSNAKEPPAKGFVANSFYSGLTASEFFFHTMGGREGLVDTAVKTAETGYMQRRMMKALEDLTVQYDTTVRTTYGDVVQFRYGDDGLDPAYMEANGRPVDFPRTLLNAQVAAAAKQRAEAVAEALRAAAGPRGGDIGLDAGVPSSASSAATAPQRGRGAVHGGSHRPRSNSASSAGSRGSSGKASVTAGLLPSAAAPSSAPLNLGAWVAKRVAGRAAAAGGAAPPINSSSSHAAAPGSMSAIVGLSPGQIEGVVRAAVSSSALPFAALAKSQGSFYNKRAGAVAAVPKASSSSSAAAAPAPGDPATTDFGGERFVNEVSSFFCGDVVGGLRKRMAALGVSASEASSSSSSAAAAASSSSSSNSTLIMRDEDDEQASLAAERASASFVGASGFTLFTPELSWPEFDTHLLTAHPSGSTPAAAGGRKAGAAGKSKAHSSSSAAAAAGGASGEVTGDQEAAAVLFHTARVTRRALAAALEGALFKYRRAIIQPGEAVGAVAAHSLGEPATQMTLKTFHFAGVASMNVTLGVPRIKEIMNGSKSISTPIIEAMLESSSSEVAARVVKARLEKTTLGDIAEYICETYTECEAYLEIMLDTKAIETLQLKDLDAQCVANAIRHSAKLRLSKEDGLVKVVDKSTVRVYPPRKKKTASRLRAARQKAKDLDKEKERAAQDSAGDARRSAHGAGGTADSQKLVTDAVATDHIAILQEMEEDDGQEDDDDEAPRRKEEDEDDKSSDDDTASETDAAVMKRGGRGDKKSAAAAGKARRSSKAHDDDDMEDDEERLKDYFKGIQERSYSGNRDDTYFALQALKAQLPSVIVMGIPTVSRAVITQDESKPGQAVQYKLLVEGYDLQRVMGTPGVKASKTSSNHVVETERFLGIEAARSTIMSELRKTYGSYGINIDNRHLQLLADVMTYRGEVLGVTRFGIAKMKDSVLMLASFEKTPDHLFDAAIHARTDMVKGVSESIIVGTPVPLGTGLFKTLQMFPTPPSSSTSSGAGLAGGAARRVDVLAELRKATENLLL